MTIGLPSPGAGFASTPSAWAGANARTTLTARTPLALRLRTWSKTTSRDWCLFLPPLGGEGVQIEVGMIFLSTS